MTSGLIDAHRHTHMQKGDYRHAHVQRGKTASVHTYREWEDCRHIHMQRGEMAGIHTCREVKIIGIHICREGEDYCEEICLYILRVKTILEMSTEQASR